MVIYQPILRSINVRIVKASTIDKKMVDDNDNDTCAACGTRDMYVRMTTHYKLKDGSISTYNYVYKSTCRNAEGNLICRICYLRAKLASYRISLMTKVLCPDGVKCAHCGYDKDIRALQIDHRLGGGAAEQKRYGNNHTMYVYYLKHPKIARKKLQILCCNCNRIKVHVMKEHSSGGFKKGRKRNKKRGITELL